MHHPAVLVSLLALLALPLPLAAQEDEAKKRDAFAKEFKDKAPAKSTSRIPRTTVKRKMDLHGL